jgi:hypothetical protein
MNRAFTGSDGQQTTSTTAAIAHSDAHGTALAARGSTRSD